MGSRTQLLDFADLLQRVSPDVSALVQMLDVDGFAAACAARLHLDSPSSVRAGQASTSDPGVAGVRNLDLSAIGLPQQLEQARLMEAGGWGAAVGINLEDERSESQPSDIDGVARQSSPQEDYDDVDLDELAAQQAEGKGQGVVKRAWTVEEDDSLLQLVREHGPRRWSVIASQLPDRVGKQCRERWHNHLCPSVNKEEWTEEEDQLIMELVQQMGTKWSKIVKMLPGRTDNAIKNRWNSTMRKNLRRQLKEQGGSSPVFQHENLPARKRGSATSAEIATAAAAAAVNAAAAAASARGGGSRSGKSSPNNRSPISKRPPRSKARSPTTGPAGAAMPGVMQEEQQQAERQQQLALLGEHADEGEESRHSPQHSPLQTPLHRPLSLRASRPEVGGEGMRYNGEMGLWSTSGLHSQAETLPVTQAPCVASGFQSGMRMEMHAALSHDWMASYQAGDQQDPLGNSAGGQIETTCLQDQLLMM